MPNPLSQRAGRTPDVVTDGWLVWARKKPRGKRHLVLSESGGVLPYALKSDSRFVATMRANGFTEWELVHVSADPTEWKFLTPLVFVDVVTGLAVTSQRESKEGAHTAPRRMEENDGERCTGCGALDVNSCICWPSNFNPKAKQPATIAPEPSHA